MEETIKHAAQAGSFAIIKTPAGRVQKTRSSDLRVAQQNMAARRLSVQVREERVGVSFVPAERALLDSRQFGFRPSKVVVKGEEFLDSPVAGDADPIAQL